MDHVLKTYPDGSQLTTKHVVIICATGIAISVISTTMTMVWEERDLIKKKFKKTFKKIDK